MKRLANLPLDEVDWISNKMVKELKISGAVTLLDLALMSPESLRQIGFKEDSLKMIQRAFEGFSYIKKAVDVLAPSNRIYLKHQKNILLALKNMKKVG